MRNVNLTPEQVQRVIECLKVGRRPPSESRVLLSDGKLEECPADEGVVSIINYG